MDKTAVKAFAVLEKLAATDSPIGVTKIARALSLSKSSTHRVLATLTALGYARQGADGNYELTLKLWEQGAKVLNRTDLFRAARSHLVKLRNHTDETVHLAMLDRRSVIYVDKIESSHPIREFTRIGDRAPIHCTATGKVLVAFQRTEIPSGPYPVYTRSTIVNQKRFSAELTATRRQGYALNFGEYGASVNGLAAPVANGTGAVVAAVAISGPAERVKPATLRTFLVPLLVATRRISRSLGCRVSLPGWEDADVP